MHLAKNQNLCIEANDLDCKLCDDTRVKQLKAQMNTERNFGKVI